jgi:hypothetical protein
MNQIFKLDIPEEEKIEKLDKLLKKPLMED